MRKKANKTSIELVENQFSSNFSNFFLLHVVGRNLSSEKQKSCNCMPTRISIYSSWLPIFFLHKFRDEPAHSLKMEGIFFQFYYVCTCLLTCPYRNDHLVTRLSQACHKVVTSLSQPCHKVVTTLSQACEW